MKILIGTITTSVLLSIIAATAADMWISTRIPVFGSFFGITYTHNPGIAWGIRLPAGIQELLISIALLAVLYLAIQAQKTGSSRLSVIAYGLVVGGGFANIVDRFRDGVVTDYIQIGSFPVFNVADTFVTIGVVLLLLESILSRKPLHNS